LSSSCLMQKSFLHSAVTLPGKLPKPYRSAVAILKRFKELSANGNCKVPFSTRWVHDQTKKDGRLFVAALGSSNATKRVLIVANEHAREAITAEVALRFAEWSCHGSEEAVRLFSEVRFTVVPVANLAGRRVIDSGEDPCQRATVDEGEGIVDLNRNMDVDFKLASDHGTAPFSTYQARILRSLAESERPVAYVDLHSGARSLMVSWGAREATSKDFPDQRRLLEVVKKAHCPDCAIGSNMKVIGYQNPGEILDHMYAVQGIKYSTLWEVYEGDDTNSCSSYFNPPVALFEKTVEDWSGALRAFGRLVRETVESDERSSESWTQRALGLSQVTEESARGHVTGAKSPGAVLKDFLT